MEIDPDSTSVPVPLSLTVCGVSEWVKVFSFKEGFGDNYLVVVLIILQIVIIIIIIIIVCTVKKSLDCLYNTI